MTDGNKKKTTRTKTSSRITVPKTLKMYVNGAFIRSERGRVLKMNDAKGNFVANYPWATRKDFRNAVVAARKAQHSWFGRTAFNRGQILYRVAEMLEDRRALLEDDCVRILGMKKDEATKEVSTAIDRVFWYAGWTDKYLQILGSVNPVAAPYFNFTFPEPMGVVTILSSKTSPLLGTLSGIIPVILSGNTCVVVSESNAPSLLVTLGEVFATSDLPPGVVNILTGNRDELLKHIASHMDVNGISAFGATSEEKVLLQTEGAGSVKRVSFFDDPTSKDWSDGSQQSLYWVTPFIEYKTAWHPMGF